ncbi:uncharacterized protein [Polyergus mexicanus]|uniref:uncharacterized protein isoform X2 n=1 Tax=Polyergus mexicanus TaxID=615972 RepID=UPI0038B4A055
MTVPTVPPVPTMSTKMHEYYFFDVKETVDGKSGGKIFLSRLNLDLKSLRTKLRKLFGVPENRRIFYIDDDGDNVPIDSECEFHEALKLAKHFLELNNAIPLIVGSFNMSDDEQSSCMHENRCSDKEQSKNVDVKPIWKNKRSFIYSDLRKPNSIQGPGTLSKMINFSKRRLDVEYDEQKHTNCKMSNQKKLDAKQCNELNEIKVRRMDEQTESKDVDVQGELNASLQHCSDALPPLWFTKYMESMKKDMVSTITNEVVENVTKALTERLDSLVFSPLKNQFGSQYSSLATQHLQCSSDSNEENQKKIRSQDKEQLNDVSIERADESRNENTMKNIQMKKDVISTITNEVVKEVTELLDKIPADSLTPVSCKDPFCFPSSTRLSQNSFDSSLSEKNQKTIKLQDREQSNDNILTVRVDESSWYSKILDNSTRLLQRRLDLIEDAIRANAEKEKKKRQDQQIAQAIVELSGDIGIEKEQSVQNNMREDLISRKNLPLQMDSKVSNDRDYLEMFKLVENEFRMNCSVTGHQMLNEGLLSRDTLVCDTFDNKLLKTEKDVQEMLSNNLTNSWSCNQEQKEEKEKEEDDDAFEIIHMHALNDDLSITPFEEPIEQQHDSNRDSPSFELLSEPSSPPCSIHLNEDHFSANEEKLEQQSMETNPTNSVYVMDVHGKIFNDEHQRINLDEYVNVDLKKQPDVTYFVAKDEDLLTEDEDEVCSPKSPCAEHRSNARKSPRDDVNGSYDDVRNSHASYLTVQTHCDSKTQSQCNCESQTDLGDFTQSFHSHTTSMTDDTTDIYVHTYVNDMHDEPVISTTKDVREATTTVTAPPKNNHDVRVDGGWTKEIRTNQNHHYKCPNNYPEYSCAPNNNCSCSRDPSFDALYQSYRMNKSGESSDRSCSNIGSRKALSSTREQALLRAASVHMLPETLVSAAAQVGSFAFDTAREMFDKLRAHTDDPLKRHGEVKCENKKPFPVGHLPF